MINDQMNKIYFPLHMNDLQARLNFKRIDEEEIEIGGAKVSVMFVNHPSFAIGYRISQNGKSLVYISDNEPFDPDVAQSLRNVDERIVREYTRSEGDSNQRLYDFVRGADLLIHDATYTPEEYAERNGWGHSPYTFTLKVAAKGNVKHLILFHHDPSHTDVDLDAIYAKVKTEMQTQKYTFECTSAMEGMELVL